MRHSSGKLRVSGKPRAGWPWVSPFRGRCGRLRGVVGGLVLAVLAGCAPQLRTHGNAPSEAELAQIVVGRDGRESVAGSFGPPFLKGLRGDDSWYYVESRFRHVGGLPPREVAREVVEIRFDAAGRVADIARYGLEDGRIITLSRRVSDLPGDRTPYLNRILRGLFGR